MTQQHSGQGRCLLVLQHAHAVHTGLECNYYCCDHAGHDGGTLMDTMRVLDSGSRGRGPFDGAP